MSNYFDAFSIAQYNGQFCRLITNRAALTQEMAKNTSAYYPYQLHESERPDTLSFMYYNDPSMEWLLFFANEIIDPYYQWYLNDEQMYEMMISKYGSLSNAQQKTRHFEVSWVNDSSTKTVSEYALLPSVAPTNLKQYWAPVLDDNGSIVYYARKRMEMTVATNKIIQIDLDRSDDYVVGEIVYQTSGNAATASAEVELVGDGYLIVKHVYGTFQLAALIGQDSGVSHTVTGSTVLVQNIPASEETYWIGVSFYDYELALNEQRKSLRIIDRNYTDVARSNLKNLMGT